jgi:flagellar biosynthetic protein FliQ
VVGLLVSIFQATTQIQEQTLAFVPKIVAVFLSILFFGPWMLQHVVEFTQRLLGNLSQYIG